MLNKQQIKLCLQYLNANAPERKSGLRGVTRHQMFDELKSKLEGINYTSFNYEMIKLCKQNLLEGFVSVKGPYGGWFKGQSDVGITEEDVEDFTSNKNVEYEEVVQPAPTATAKNRKDVARNQSLAVRSSQSKTEQMAPANIQLAQFLFTLQQESHSERQRLLKRAFSTMAAMLNE